jgi:hypothetical protein
MEHDALWAEKKIVNQYLRQKHHPLKAPIIL